MGYRDITAAQARAVFSYDPMTGIVSRRVKSTRGEAGPVSNDNGDGYSRVVFAGCRVYLHRLVWLLHYGEWPKGQIDHIDGNRLNNAITNLRDVPHEINAQNEHRARKNNHSTGVLGVSYVPSRKKYEANITVSGQKVHLGRFDTVERAQIAYLTAKRAYHEGCTI